MPSQEYSTKKDSFAASSLRLTLLKAVVKSVCCDYLCGEADVLERLVLAPGADDVGERAVGELVERCRDDLLAGAQQPAEGDDEAEETVDEHQELGVVEAEQGPVRHHVVLWTRVFDLIGD